jgi:hypothetical protein
MMEFSQNTYLQKGHSLYSKVQKESLFSGSLQSSDHLADALYQVHLGVTCYSEQLEIRKIQPW